VRGYCPTERRCFDLNDLGDSGLPGSIFYVDSSGYAINSTRFEQVLEDLIDGMAGSIDKKIANGKWLVIDKIIEMTANVTGYRHGFFLLSGRSEKHQFFFPAGIYEKADGKVQLI
jgi:hypothetical protein